MDIKVSGDIKQKVETTFNAGGVLFASILFGFGVTLGVSMAMALSKAVDYLVHLII